MPSLRMNAVHLGNMAGGAYRSTGPCWLPGCLTLTDRQLPQKRHDETPLLNKSKQLRCHRLTGAETMDNHATKWKQLSQTDRQWTTILQRRIRSTIEDVRFGLTLIQKSSEETRAHSVKNTLGISPSQKSASCSSCNARYRVD